MMTIPMGVLLVLSGVDVVLVSAPPVAVVVETVAAVVDLNYQMGDIVTVHSV